MNSHKKSLILIFSLLVATQAAFGWANGWPSFWAARTTTATSSASNNASDSIAPTAAASNYAPVGSNLWVNKETQILKNEAGNINPKVLRLSLQAYLHARKKGLDSRGMLTVIDYSKPSTERRLWVFDLRSNRTLFNTWVTHGKNSGATNAYSFSNQVGSLKSSLGVFVTDSTYFGHNGYSLKLRGLEPGVNDNALRRNIVIHGATYVGANTLQRYGQIGRSWGCPAVSKNTSTPLIDTIKQKTIVFAYYPDPNWLSHSSFLT